MKTIIIAAIAASLIFAGCEDSTPKTYKEQVQAQFHVYDGSHIPTINIIEDTLDRTSKLLIKDCRFWENGDHLRVQQWYDVRDYRGRVTNHIVTTIQSTSTWQVTESTSDEITPGIEE